MKKKSEGKTRKCLTLLGGRTSLLLCLSLMFQSSYAAEDSTVPEMGNMEIHQIAQQSSTIKGVVKDQKGEPLIGVSIVVDAEKVKREESAYKKIPVITNFTDEDGNDRMKETVQANYRRIKEEVKQIVQEELERIKNDPVLCKLLPDNETV